MPRQYESTHPHLSFDAAMSGAEPQLWIALGECQSKCEHIARVPLRPDTARRLNTVYLAKGVLGTTAIEGNTLSEDEVVRHIDGELELPPSRRQAPELAHVRPAYSDDEADRHLYTQFRADVVKSQVPRAPPPHHAEVSW